MHTVIHTLTLYLHLQEKICKWLLLLLGLAMTLLILLQIFFRFVVYVPFPWSEECARYLMIWMGMLGSVLALQQGRHIGVQVFVEKLPATMQYLAKLLVQLALIGFLATLFRQGIEFASFNADQMSPAMEVSMLIPYTSLPVGTAMMLAVLACDLLTTLFPSASARKEGLQP